MDGRDICIAAYVGLLAVLVFVGLWWLALVFLATTLIVVVVMSDGGVQL